MRARNLKTNETSILRTLATVLWGWPPGQRFNPVAYRLKYISAEGLSGLDLSLVQKLC